MITLVSLYPSYLIILTMQAWSPYSLQLCGLIFIFLYFSFVLLGRRRVGVFLLLQNTDLLMLMLVLSSSSNMSKDFHLLYLGNHMSHCMGMLSYELFCEVCISVPKGMFGSVGRRRQGKKSKENDQGR